MPWPDEQGLPLLERERELGLLARLVEELGAGRGGVAVVEGVAGIGKTRLLSAVAARARSVGAWVMWARGSELEERFPFGVVRQLFEAPVRARSGDDRDRLLRGAGLAGELLLGSPGPLPGPAAPSAGDVMFGMVHALYWLVVNLSDEAPVLMLVDDVQWADEPSQRFLAFCGARVAELPVGFVVTRRSGADRRDTPADALARLPGVAEIRPGALSDQGIARLLSEALGMDPDDGFVEACRVASGGVPFYAWELGRELVRAGITPTAANAARVAELGPESLVRAVVARLGGPADPSTRVARALAVLGGHADPGEVAATAELDLAAAGRAQETLARAGILDGRRLAFQHPVIAASVYADIPVIERERLHARAATALRAAGAPADRVAAQLLRAPASGEAGTVEVLRAAAGDAVARGGPADAVPLLRRALAEPPQPDALPRVLLDLGAAELAAGQLADAAAHLGAALDVAGPSLRGPVALALGRALASVGRLEEAAHLADRVGKQLEATDPELALRLELDFLTAARSTAATFPLVPERIRALAAKAGTSTPTRRFALAWLAWHGATINEPAQVVADRARRALGGGDLAAAEPPDSPLHWVALLAPILVDEFAVAERGIGLLAAEAQRKGAIAGLAMARLLAALLGLRRGTLLDAEADAWEALRLVRAAAAGALPMAVTVATEVLIERGDLDRAAQLMAEPIPPHLTGSTGFYPIYLFARGTLHLARHRWQEALDDLLASGRAHLEYQVTGAAVAWRSSAAMAALALGDRDTATELAQEELRLAEAFGTPRTLAVALRAAGQVAGGENGLELLGRAVEILHGRGIHLEEAHALTDLGTMLRHRGAIGPARDRLRAGLDLAVRCAATPLAERARQELTAAGARPRRSALTGAAALTATERRVSQLAADGLSNREIAHTLFVTGKTVELHLTNSYRKLGITSRSQLPAALEPRGQPRADRERRGGRR